MNLDELNIKPQVKTALDRNPLIYIFDTIEYKGAASSTVQVDDEITVAHNLGYIPKFNAYVSNDNITYRRMSNAQQIISGMDIYLDTEIAKANKIELKFRFTRLNTTGPGTVTLTDKYIKYYIFRERIA